MAVHLPPHEKSPNDAEAIIRKLDALEPSKVKQRIKLFAELYPGIVRAIDRGVPQKDILAMLKHEGLPLHPKSFREMLDAERNCRNEHGESDRCDSGEPVLVAPANAADEMT